MPEKLSYFRSGDWILPLVIFISTTVYLGEALQNGSFFVTGYLVRDSCQSLLVLQCTSRYWQLSPGKLGGTRSDMTRSLPLDP